MAIDKTQLIHHDVDGGVRAFTDDQVERAEVLMEEVPRIEAALKNFLSLKMAEGLAPPAGEATASRAPASAASQAASLQGYARALLRELNALDLPSSPEWSQQHPQGATESGFDFIARIGDYKVVQVLWQRCKDAGQKPAKLLGRSALRLAFPEVKQRLLADPAAAVAAAGAGASEEQLRLFVDAFGDAISAEPGDEVAELVWATNLQAALAERQRARKAEAEERLKRAATNEGFASDLRSVLTGSPGGPTVEEVEDEEEEEQPVEVVD